MPIGNIIKLMMVEVVAVGRGKHILNDANAELQLLSFRFNIPYIEIAIAFYIDIGHRNIGKSLVAILIQTI